MAQGDFTKEECDLVRSCTYEIYTALSSRMQAKFLSRRNDLLLFIAAAKKAAPQADSLTAPQNPHGCDVVRKEP